MSASLLQAAAELAELAGQAALRYYAGGLSVERKADGSPVTLADRDAERLAREWLGRRFPRDGILGEEFGEQPGSSGRRWLLDPVDGTRSFVRGVPLWGSLVAVLEGDTVLAGAAAFPAVRERLAAAPGEGCWHNGSRCRVSDVGALADATVLITDSRIFTDLGYARAYQVLSDAAAMSRTWGDCYGYLLVATGRAEVMVDPRLNPWDGACFVPMIAEAGGSMTELSGAARSLPANAVATNGALACEVRRILGGGAPA